jgi:Icc-related predicted phosphoesterase
VEEHVVQIVATGDLHIRTGVPGTAALRLRVDSINADVLLIAGDITENGRIMEARHASALLAGIKAPILAVMGNHDLRSVRRYAFRTALVEAGITLLDGEGVVYTGANGVQVGFVGVAGCGGGFWPTEIPDAIHARAWNTLAVRQRREAAKLDLALSQLKADVRIVLMHFAPTPTTLGNEPGAKYWMLGNGELGRVIDMHNVDLVLHGHAHLGNRFGRTIRGVAVRNVSYPVNNDVVRLQVEPGQNGRWLVSDAETESMIA